MSTSACPEFGEIFTIAKSTLTFLSIASLSLQVSFAIFSVKYALGPMRDKAGCLTTVGASINCLGQLKHVI